MRWIVLFLFCSLLCMDQKHKRQKIKRSLSTLVNPGKSKRTEQLITQHQEVNILCDQHKRKKDNTLMGQLNILSDEHFTIVENQEQLQKNIHNIQQALHALVKEQKNITQCNNLLFMCFCVYFVSYMLNLMF